MLTTITIRTLKTPSGTAERGYSIGWMASVMPKQQCKNTALLSLGKLTFYTDIRTRTKKKCTYRTSDIQPQTSLQPSCITGLCKFQAPKYTVSYIWGKNTQTKLSTAGVYCSLPHAWGMHTCTVPRMAYLMAKQKKAYRKDDIRLTASHQQLFTFSGSQYYINTYLFFVMLQNVTVFLVCFFRFHSARQPSG